jgi:hypothetical protein
VLRTATVPHDSCEERSEEGTLKERKELLNSPAAKRIHINANEYTSSL